MVNLTLEVNEDTLRRARIKALREGSSVSRILTDHLERFVDDDTASSGWSSFLESARSAPARSDGGRDWNRAELYQR